VHKCELYAIVLRYHSADKENSWNVPSRKQKADGVEIIFSVEWKSKYFFIQYASKFACIVSQKNISLMKEYIRPHYNKEHE
jgi:hypothetical protein